MRVVYDAASGPGLFVRNNSIFSNQSISVYILLNIILSSCMKWAKQAAKSTVIKVVSMLHVCRRRKRKHKYYEKYLAWTKSRTVLWGGRWHVNDSRGHKQKVCTETMKLNLLCYIRRRHISFCRDVFQINSRWGSLKFNYFAICVEFSYA